MMHPLYTDIETVGLASALAAPYPTDRQPPRNYVKPEAIEAWHERDKAAWQQELADKAALSPLTGRVVCLGMALDSDASIQMAEEEDDEKRLLDNFWQMAAPHECGPQLVTFNGLGFDLRFLVIRSIVHGVTPSLNPLQTAKWFRRYTTETHYDCRAVLTGWNPYAEGTLAEYCTAFGIPAPEGKGSDVARWYAAKDFGAIRSHCASDIASLKALHQKIVGYFG